MKNKITLEYKDNMIVHTNISSTTHILCSTLIPIELIDSVEENNIFSGIYIHTQNGWKECEANSKTQAKKFARQIRKWMKEYHKHIEGVK